MAVEFRLPQLGENVTSGDVIKVLVSKGDRIEAEDPVFEIETDKATLEVPVDLGGTVSKVHVNEGDEVEIGQVLLTIEPEGEGESGKKESEETPGGRAKDEAKGKGKQRREEEGAAEPPAEERQRQERTERREEPQQREESQEGEAKEELEESQEAEEPQAGGAVEGDLLAIAPAAPSVRRLARELGVDVHEVQGSGPEGRITVDDVKRHVWSILSRDGATGSRELPDFERWGEVEREPLGTVRRRTAEHMVRSWSLPMVTHHERADVSWFEEARARYAEKNEGTGGRLTITTIGLKVLAVALKRFPRLNASLDLPRKELIVKKYCHIGVAVDTPRGLVVPVVRNVDRKNVHELAVELVDLADRARDRRIRPEQLEGGTFTLTNIGGIGGAHFTPIVNWPQVAILGLSRTRTEAVHREGEFRARALLPLSLTYDHRVIDGAEAARFARWVAEALEEPFLLMFDN